jgi:hypothetical protein
MKTNDRRAGRQLALRLHDELVVDNFAGGGGTSLGIEWALGMVGNSVPLEPCARPTEEMLFGMGRATRPKQMSLS